MARSDEHAHEALIRESERILRKADAVPQPGQPAAQADRGVDARAELASLKAAETESADGYAEVRISEDRMMAVASFHPPLGAGKQIELLEVKELLIARGLRFGIDWDAVRSSILSCNTSRKAVIDVEIARGRRPIDEIPAQLELQQSLLKKESQDSPESQSVDFKARSPFRFVKKGDILARTRPRIDGESGIDVTGAVVAYGKAQLKSHKPGRNTLVHGDTVTAGAEGRFVVGEDSFWVSEVLEIPGNVDYSTGHIDFPGDVVVHGEVKQGFKVKTGGSLTCIRLIDATEIVCGADLETGQGILGRMEGTVKVAGTIRAKFIENCYVEAGGDVQVSTGCLNSVINTLGAVVTGSRGVIIGGKVYAQKGVIAFQIGSSAGVRTEIHCGVDYRVQQKLAWIRDRNIELALKLKEVEATIAGKGPQNPRLVELRDRLKEALRRMNESARRLSASLDKNEGAAVVAKGEIHHGVFVEICHVPLVVSKSLGPVRLVLDKTFGVIAPDRPGRV